jgi:signal transduction histidine kinase
VSTTAHAPTSVATALGRPFRARDQVAATTVRSLPGPALFAIVAFVYLTLAQFVIWLNDPVNVGAGFWPAAGFSLALLLLLPGRRWPWVLAGVAVAEFGGDLLHGYPLEAIAFWTAGNTIEPLVGAVLIRRLATRHGTLTPVSALAGFVTWGVVVGPLVGATIGSLGTILFAGGAPATVWPKYVVGDALGVLVVAPLLLTWNHRSAPRTRLEAVLLGVSATVVTVLVFQNWVVAWDVTLPYLIVPFLMWAGVRFGLRGAAIMGFIIANIANWATASNYGPFAIAGGQEHAVTLVQVFLGITLTSGLVLASLASDLTDSREMARRQAEHNAERQRGREFRDAFIGVLSHEIRTPITTLYGMSELLRSRRDSMDAASVGQYLDDIGAEADRLRRLTEDLLVLSRAEGGRLDVAANPVAIAPLVRATVKAEQARSPRHEFVVQMPGALPVVLGEDGYVEQVLRNYLGNAAKYSAPGSSIRVVVGNEDGGVALRVIDEGPGLPDGSADRLFDLFYRAPDAIANTGGAGIGLFVCRKLIEAMGGRVWATAGPADIGAEFGLWLPVADDALDED